MTACGFFFWYLFKGIFLLFHPFIFPWHDFTFDWMQWQMEWNYMLFFFRARITHVGMTRYAVGGRLKWWSMRVNVSFHQKEWISFSWLLCCAREWVGGLTMNKWKMPFRIRIGTSVSAIEVRTSSNKSSDCWQRHHQQLFHKHSTAHTHRKMDCLKYGVNSSIANEKMCYTQTFFKGFTMFFFSFLPKVVFSCSLFSIFSLCILGVWCCSFYFNIFSASLVLRCSMPRKLIVCWGEFLVWFPFLNGNSFACQSGAHRNTHTSTQHIYVLYLHSFIIIYEYFMNFKHSTHLFKEHHRKNGSVCFSNADGFVSECFESRDG